MSVEIKVRGNLGQNLNLRAVNNPARSEPNLVLNFSIASQQFKRKADGSGFEPVGDVEWLECEYWNRNASHLHKILQKGMPIVAIGEERMETYQDKNGATVRVRKLRVEELYIVPSDRIESIVMRAAKREPSETAAPEPAASVTTAAEYAAASQASGQTPNQQPQYRDDGFPM